MNKPKTEYIDAIVHEIEQHYRLSEVNLKHFVRASFPVLEPGVRFVDGWHIDCMCEHLELVASGDIQILIITVPPAHMKSLTATVCFPVWTWIKWPESRWIFSSYSSELSTAHSLKRRRLIKSDWFQYYWAKNFQLVDDQDRKMVFENNKKGVFLSTSTGGTSGGKHGDVIIADDSLNPEAALSDPKRLESNSHVEYLITTRMRDPKTSRFVLIMQCLHEDDAVRRVENITDKLCKDNPDLSTKCKRLSLQAEAEKRTVITFPNSKKEIVREEGDILWPERFDRRQLSVIKEAKGSFFYASQFQQNPAPFGGGLVKLEWFRRWNKLPNIIRCGWFWDTAIKIKSVNDYSVGILIAECETGYYALDLCRKRLIYPDLKAEIKSRHENSQAHFTVVEDKASGQQIVQELSKDVSFPIIPFEPKGDKTQRLSLVSPIIESGKFFLPGDAPWTKVFIDEFLFFPHGTFDDCVDAGVMGLTYLHLGKKSGTFRDSMLDSAPTMAGPISERPIW